MIKTSIHCTTNCDTVPDLLELFENIRGDQSFETHCMVNAMHMSSIETIRIETRACDEAHLNCWFIE